MCSLVAPIFQLQLTSLSLNLSQTFGEHTVFHGFRILCHYAKPMTEYQIQNWDPACVSGWRLGGSKHRTLGTNPKAPSEGELPATLTRYSLRKK